MDILGIITKSIKETFLPRRFLPFFLLYLLFSICALIFIFPIIQVLPSFLSAELTKSQVAVAIVNLSGLFIVFLLIVFVNLWFTGALIHDVHKRKGFDFGLEQAKKQYWQILALGFVLFFLFSISSFLKNFAILARIAIDLVFIFSFPSIVIKKDSFELALKRSCSFVKKNLLETFVFLILTYFILFIILFISALLVAFSFFPLFLGLISLPIEKIEAQRIVQIISLFLSNYPSLVLSSVIISFFLAISQVFIYTSRTYYFLELTKRKIRLY